MAEFKILDTSYNSDFALKIALIKYKEDGKVDKEMLEFLCDSLLENKSEYELFIPEII